ncbi:DUF2920 family protein [Clostridium beijerinckii]|uniref:DUF2920 family protein n=1 Tax=Clostridium beijerinckii TaxID=1520 RepID=UPI00080A3200|nr:DUF2920 family protein [Clostridium beijerinckii]OCA96800.1 hypothetical protein BGS1_05970 [Clostridium beijerinckii]
MATTRKISLKAPVDPEINIEVRESLDYYITFPDGYNKSKSYGLVFCISGYGYSAESDYQANKLRPYISDKYNMITVGVRYHNDLRIDDSDVQISLGTICNWYGIDSNYFNNVTSSEQIIDKIFEILQTRNIFSLDSRLSFKVSAYNKYSSFGFMPAIDHLNVLFDIIQRYNIDKNNIIAFGTSYGGYIASLMAKYAPHTFSLVIDNSGFCVAQLQEVLGGQVGGAGGAIVRYLNNTRYEIPYVANTLWSLDETSEYYFGDSKKKIRNLLIEDHRTPSSTVYCCYHSEKDTLAPIKLKDDMYNCLEKYNITYYKRVKECDVDGRVFKNSSHGMNASLRMLFDTSMEKYKKHNNKKDDDIDFDRNVVYGFPCADKLYNFSYSNSGLNVEIDEI